MRSDFSKTVTRWPALFNWSAAARPAGPEPTTATRLPVRVARRRGANPALLERPLDDRQLDVLDRHRIVVDAEDARAFARRRAQPAGEVREVVGRVQAIARRLPAVPVDEIVPVRNLVAERAALVAERDAAVHAARRPDRGLPSRASAGRPRASPGRAASTGRACGLVRLIWMKPVDVTHWPPPPAPRTPARGSPSGRAPRRAAPACSRAESP